MAKGKKNTLTRWNPTKVVKQNKNKNKVPKSLKEGLVTESSHTKY